MHYRAQITLTDLKSGKAVTFERTVLFEREKSSLPPHDPLAIDVDQKRRVLRFALNEALEDAVRGYPA